MKYETPLTAQSACEVWSRVCAQSVVTEVMFNQIESAAQESGGTVDFADKSTYDSFNHSWEDAGE